MTDHTEKPAPITDVLAEENAALRSERDLLRDMIRNIHPDMRGDAVVEYLKKHGLKEIEKAAP